MKPQDRVCRIEHEDAVGTILRVTLMARPVGGAVARVRVRWDTGAESTVDDRSLRVIAQDGACETVAQKMTDHEFTAAIDSKIAREMTSSALTFATDEALRARSEEQRLLKERVELDAKVQSMADALDDARRLPVSGTLRACWCLTKADVRRGHSESCKRIQAAIRLVGR